jgi:hypothetical protein
MMMTRERLSNGVSRAQCSMSNASSNHAIAADSCCVAHDALQTPRASIPDNLWFFHSYRFQDWKLHGQEELKTPRMD